MTPFPVSGQSNDKNAEQQEKKALYRRYEGDMLSYDSDRSKLVRQNSDISVELRDIQKKWTNLGFEIKEKQELLKKNEDKLRFVEEEIRQLKKKMNNL